ncbi:MULTISPECIES: hypothetical protein [Streptomycetaceae]|uniref:Uncharacterized protein n=1 Tax=Streptantibioticus cattleyicolor (strain ATCC 35852 / DSM 46488 / JCM 4925 / NBRC 14057 / NRRL 8057) TaxID=1003195 RepID=F8JNX3_STREN|nr:MULTISPECIES: hypothetical protein [Streptomycetaceae]AEW93913.1 hypothetical protein SCATT_15420 [Streptantibioticus cattleyicolor NRRL 8057 = DSM 46488]CCB74260.1 protein of unknown function [Streptantibioticus cattleyicolor NRRL 8057 = DSM 46488]
MAPEEQDEPLVTITPVPPPSAAPEQRWLGPLLIIGAPVGLAVLVFVLLVLL